MTSDPNEQPPSQTRSRSTTKRLAFPLTKSQIAVLLLVLVVAALTIGLRARNGMRLNASKEKASVALASYQEGRFDKAISKLEEAISLNAGNVEAQRLLGQSYEATGKLKEATAAYEKSLAADPDQPEVLYKLAVIYKSQNELKPAIETLEKAVSLKPEFVGARLILGDLLVREGETDRAKEQYEAVVRMKPFGVDLKAVNKKLEGL
jgi:tetratricopeptide (TPR) repeat protein